MKHKNWPLFMWALKRWRVDHKKCLRNDILLRLMNLSGVTPKDMLNMLQEITNELEKREGL